MAFHSEDNNEFSLCLNEDTDIEVETCKYIICDMTYTEFKLCIQQQQLLLTHIMLKVSFQSVTHYIS